MNIDYKSTLSATYGLPMDDIELLLSHTSAIKFAKGDFIVRKGGRNNNLYLVEQGVIRAFRENDAEEVALWFAAEGEVVLQVWGYCRDLPSEENFQCETDCLLHVISNKEIERLCSESLHFANMIRILFQNHAMLMEDFLIFFADNKSAEERYLSMLKRHPNIFNQVSLKKLASFLYITPQSLSRIRAGLKRSE